MTGIAVVGAGHWGPHLIRNFNDHDSSQVLWVIERDDRRRKAIAGRFPSVSVSGDLDDALQDGRVDAVVVATPTSTHSSIVSQVLKAGKHVLVEKPITDSLTDSVALCKLADRQSLILMVGHVFLFNSVFRAVKEYLREARLGQVQYLSMTRTNLGPVRADVNAAWDLASHDISIANFWLDALPKSVSATGGSWLNEGVEDAVFITLQYPEDILVHIEASWLSPRKRRLISVIGSQRMLTVDDTELNEPVRIYDKGVVGSEADEITDTFAGFRAQIREGDIVIPRLTAGEPLRNECEEFLNRITGGAAQVSSGWDATNVVAVLEAIDESIACGGRTVDVESDR